MRKLQINEIDFRVGMIKKNAKGVVFCTLLAYKDARVDMAVLDEIFGSSFWQVKYKRDTNGVLQCGIGVFCELNETTSDWVWKWSNGTESQTEATKGEYSDAFKRAGFMWGIGRELYDMPFLYVEMREGEYFEKDGRVRQSGSFKPNDWKWEMTDNAVTASDKSGQRVNARR